MQIPIISVFPSVQRVYSAMWSTMATSHGRQTSSTTHVNSAHNSHLIIYATDDNSSPTPRYSGLHFSPSLNDSHFLTNVHVKLNPPSVLSMSDVKLTWTRWCSDVKVRGIRSPHSLPTTLLVGCPSLTDT